MFRMPTHMHICIDMCMNAPAGVIEDVGEHTHRSQKDNQRNPENLQYNYFYDQE